MLLNIGKSRALSFVVLVAALLVVINLLRAWKVPITYDEAWTYEAYLNNSYYNIVHNIPVIANNHILNTLITKFIVQFAGPAPIVLRLTNILALPVYLYFSWKILCRLMGCSWWAVGSFLLLQLNPFLFDFWGLCRGYGLSIALMSASVYYFIHYYQENKHWYLHASLIAGILSVYANFTLLNYFLIVSGLLAIHNITHLQTQWRSLLLKWLVIAVYAFLLYKMIWDVVNQLKQAGELYFGGSTGLVRDTFYSFIRESTFTYEDKAPRNLAIAYFVYALIIIAGINWLYLLYKDMRHKNAQTGFILWLLLAVPLLSTVVQHKLMGNPYLMERSALFLYPLFVLQLVYCLYYWAACYTKTMAAIITGLVAIFSFNFFTNLNFRYARSWVFDQYNVLVLNKMINDKPNKKLNVRFNWHFLSAVNYYLATDTVYGAHFSPLESRWSEPRNGGVYDYLYITDEDNNIDITGYKVDTSFENGKLMLLKRLP